MKKGKKLHGNKETVVKVCNWLSLPLQALGCCILYLVIEAFSGVVSVDASLVFPS